MNQRTPWGPAPQLTTLLTEPLLALYCACPFADTTARAGLRYQLSAAATCHRIALGRTRCMRLAQRREAKKNMFSDSDVYISTRIRSACSPTKPATITRARGTFPPIVCTKAGKGRRGIFRGEGIEHVGRAAGLNGRNDGLEYADLGGDGSAHS